MTPYTSPVPQIGLGTYRRTGPGGLAAILTGLEIGYRHLDTAQAYDTEANVGEAVRRAGLAREEVFLTTKVAEGNIGRARFAASVARSLATLGVDCVDLLLIHWPSPRDEVPLEDYITALAEAQARGQARLIGVSNFTIDHLRRCRAILGPEALATNQVELHPWLQAPRLRDWARANGLMLTAYQPLVRGRLLSDPVLAEIGARRGVAATTVALAFLMAEGHAVIPASSSPANLAANFAAAALQLDYGEMSRIRALDRGYRAISPATAPDWDD